MPIEVDEAELTRLRGAEKLMQELLGSSKTKRGIHRAIKELHPDYEEPAPGAVETIADAKAAAESVLNEHLKKTANDKLEADFQAKVDSYRLSKDNPDGFTDEGIDKIKQLMRDRTIPDFDAAVALFEKMNPAKAEPPSGFAPTSWGFGAPPTDDDTKLLFSNPEAYQDREILKVFDEARKGTLT